jgi:hypothetical protein
VTYFSSAPAAKAAAPKTADKKAAAPVVKAAPKAAAKGKAPAGGVVKKAQAAKKAVLQGTHSKSKSKIRTSIRFHKYEERMLRIS